jgi:hypothetical protein
MSEARPIFISCAAGENAFTDTMVERKQGLIRLIGHPIADFAPREAAQLANHILNLLKEIQS